MAETTTLALAVCGCPPDGLEGGAGMPPAPMGDAGTMRRTDGGAFAFAVLLGLVRRRRRG